MAPFKLKFRMGSSRSASQEHDQDPQVNEALLNHHQHHSTTIGASSSTIDSTDCTSLGSIGTNERKSLLPNKSNNLRLGYIDHRATTCNDESSAESNTIPTTPPSTYDHMLEGLNAITRDASSINDRRDSLNNPRNSIILTSLEHLSLSEEITIECTDPNCQEIYKCNRQILPQRQQDASQSVNPNQNHLSNEVNNFEDEDDFLDDNRKESIDSTELLISTKMAASTAQASAANESPNLMENCSGDCAECESGHYNDECTDECNTNTNGVNNNGGNGNNFFDPLINHGGYCDEESHYNHENSENQLQDGCQGGRCDSDSDNGWNAHQQASNSQHHQQQQQSQAYEYSNQQSAQERSVTPEIISNKSSKEIYKDLAKQWGITCKMSDACRCMECQGHYFDCEYDDNEHQKTDGGLGAGTPMFISEVMHGSACNIL
ncbi:probable serine/threonine-protein kinase DDB_G0282963 [Ceratitis capitata]|nr:probable serine/threonine-protein kinase DDB_G0282963 [Ceratitis capitata]XP_012157752.1 probable serine/threonine-protein kinase DDB_G0282963 [Ceratitis capitata]